MSEYYVKRRRGGSGIGDEPERVGWTGPYEVKHARADAAEWRSRGWKAELVLNTSEVRAQVRSWERGYQGAHQ